MKFLFFTQYFPPEIGAAQNRLGAITKQLIELGHEVEIVTAMPNYPGGKIFETYRRHFYLVENWQGAIVHRIWLFAATGIGVFRIFNYLSFAIFSFFILFMTKPTDYIFIESPPIFIGVTGIIFSKLRKIKVIFNIADLWPDSIKEFGVISDGFLFKTLLVAEKWIYDNSFLINSVTEGVKNTLIIKKAVPEEKILLLQNGIDIEEFANVNFHEIEKFVHEFKLAHKKVILYAGTHGYAHGLEVALKAANHLRNSDIFFIFVGDGSEKSKLKQLSSDMKLKNVLFMDPVDKQKLRDLFYISRIGLSTLRDLPLFEGTRPVKIFSIMAAKRPVIYCGSGEGARLIKDSNAGVITPPEDDIALARTIEALINDEDRCRILGENGFNFVKDNFLWHNIISQWLDELKRIT